VGQEQDGTTGARQRARNETKKERVREREQYEGFNALDVKQYRLRAVCDSQPPKPVLLYAGNSCYPTNSRNALNQHRTGQGSAFTQEFGFAHVEERHRVATRNASRLESQITAELMLQNGVNNVRGAAMSSRYDFDPANHQEVADVARFVSSHIQIPIRDVPLVMPRPLVRVHALWQRLACHCRLHRSYTE
jgi:hypothetical protein